MVDDEVRYMPERASAVVMQAYDDNINIILENILEE